MNSQKDIDGNLLITYDSRGWSKWFYSAAALFLALAGYDIFISPYKKDRSAGLFAGAALCVIAGLALNEKAYIKVDINLKTITWNKQIAFWKSSGILKFNEVIDVFVEKTTGTRKVPSKRISLHLANGKILPLTYGSSPDPADELTKTVALFNELLRKH